VEGEPWDGRDQTIVFQVAVSLLIYFTQKSAGIFPHVVCPGDICAPDLSRNRTVSEAEHHEHFRCEPELQITRVDMLRVLDAAY
jgi:hypothetical protein